MDSIVLPVRYRIPHRSELEGRRVILPNDYETTLYHGLGVLRQVARKRCELAFHTHFNQMKQPSFTCFQELQRHSPVSQPAIAEEFLEYLLWEQPEGHGDQLLWCLGSRTHDTHTRCHLVYKMSERKLRYMDHQECIAPGDGILCVRPLH